MSNSNGEFTKLHPPWADRGQKGRLVASIATVIRALVFPSRTLGIDDGHHQGLLFFLYAFGIWCCVPGLLLYIVFYFIFARFELNFLNFLPMIGFITMAQYLVLGPIVIWVFGWSLTAGLRIVSVASKEQRQTVKNLAWYLGTIMFCVIYACIGIMLLLSCLNFYHEMELWDNFIIGTFFVGIAAVLRTAVSSIRATFHASWIRALLGLASTLLIFMLAATAFTSIVHLARSSLGS
ncbi:MAG TPA: hypothetical protein PLI09_21575 [Candidatus Hydrogenedentes bacterium]|nr:hypothetical protein [Candidatus Hydrogenedentota bacterium]